MPKAEKPIPKLRQMVPGSIWRVTQAADLTYERGNREFEALVSTISHRMYGEDLENRNKLQPQRSYEVREKAARREAAKTVPPTFTIPLGRIAAGTVLRVSGPQAADLYVDRDFSHHLRGVMLPFEVVEGHYTPQVKPRPYGGGSPGYYLTYKALEPIVELVSIPQVLVYVIRDRETGHFLGPALYERSAPALNMVPTFAKAKKHKDLGKLKSSVMGWCGYFEGLPDGDGRPYYVEAGKITPLPATFEAVAYDKLAKEPIEVFDLQTWHDRLFRLRTLTVEYGSVVRKIYDTLEKSGALDDFQHVLVARAEVPEGYYRGEMTPDQVDAFDATVADVVEREGLKRKDLRRAKDERSMAIAFRDVDHAFLMQMLYGGELPIQVLNMRTLTVQARPVSSS